MACKKSVLVPLGAIEIQRSESFNKGHFGTALFLVRLWFGALSRILCREVYCTVSSFGRVPIFRGSL